MYKKVLALNDLQWSICHKTQPNQTKADIQQISDAVWGHIQDSPHFTESCRSAVARISVFKAPISKQDPQCINGYVFVISMHIRNIQCWTQLAMPEFSWHEISEFFFYLVKSYNILTNKV